MPDEVLQVLFVVARLLEIVGAGALVLGFIISTGICIRQYFREGAKPAVERYRKALGRTVLIGLEILVAATIIKTITLDPTFEGICFLAIMVAVRTVLGWTMVLEMYGRWPWQKQRPRTATSEDAT
jgi:uncharacterized membrane protein